MATEMSIAVYNYNIYNYNLYQWKAKFACAVWLWRRNMRRNRRMCEKSTLEKIEFPQNNPKILTKNLTKMERIEWNENETKFLLNKYEQYIGQVGPLKKYKKKTNVWRQIAFDMREMLNVRRTPVQVENRYKTMLRRKDRSIYLEQIKNIQKTEDILANTGATTSKTRHFKRNAENGTSTITSGNSLEQTLIEIFEKKEEAKERRHREKMDLIAKLLDADTQINTTYTPAEKIEIEYLPDESSFD